VTDFSFLGNKLPIGYTRKGTEFREFLLRSPKGSLRRDVLNVVHNQNLMLATALKHVIASLGDIPQPPEDFIRRLTMTDINYINFCMMVRQAVKPGIIEWEHQCGRNDVPRFLDADEDQPCKHVWTLSVKALDVDLVDIESREALIFSDEAEVFLETIFHDPVESRAVKYKARVVTFADSQNIMHRFSGKQSGRMAQGDLIFAQVAQQVVDYDGNGPLTPALLDDMDARTLDCLVDSWMSQVVPGLDLDVDGECPNCGRGFRTELPLTGWLRPFAPPPQSQK